MKRSSIKPMPRDAKNTPPVAVLFPTPAIPIIVRPGDLDDIYNYFMKARPAKRPAITKETMILVYEGEGGNA